MKANEIFTSEISAVLESVDGVLNEFYAANDNAHRKGADILPGDIYRTKSRIPPIKRGFLSKRRRVPGSARAVDAKFFSPIFLIGYESEDAGVLFEIWYDPNISVFSIYDKFGMHTGRDRRKLRQAIDDLADIVSDYDHSMTSAKAHDEIEREARRMRQIPRLTHQRTRESMEVIEKAIEESVANRAMLGKAIGDAVEEYRTTRMKKYHYDKWWRNLLGRYVIGPNDYQYKGPFGRFRKKWDELRGAHKEASFVIGYTLADQIDVEVWYVKDVNQGRGFFHVFDITGGDELGKYPTMRDAMRHVSEKIKVPYDYE